MATIVSHTPVIDYFSLPSRQSENRTITPSLFHSDESLYNDLALLSSLSCNSIDTSLGSPNPIPYSNDKYASSSQESNLDRKPALSFLPGNFDNWLSGWDDPIDSALSPTVEPPYTALKSIPLTPDTDTTELHVMPSIDLATISKGLDDNSIAFEESINDEPLPRSPQILPEITDVPPREGLYSTPLSWQRPQLCYRVSNPDSYAPLSPAEESRLRSIAMPARPYPMSPAASSSPEPQNTSNRQKRKLSNSSESDCLALKRSRCSAPKKTAHNMIEKRYRTNLNDKIATLRDSVPSLCVMAKNNLHSENLQEDLQGLSPAHKLNKATILSKATEYIAHLEKRIKYLTKETKVLEARTGAFEILIMAQSNHKSAHVVATGH